MVERFEQFSALISGAYRLVQKLERTEMGAYGLKGAFAQYLLVMSHYPQGITSAQLCEACEKDKAAVSRAVSEMESKGLVVREGEGEQSYRALLFLTDEGRRAAEFVSQRASVAVVKANEGISEEQRRVFYETLEQFNENLQRICESGIPKK